ncbi:hypothetical protein D3C76_1144710 [compost metagenome]
MWICVGNRAKTSSTACSIEHSCTIRSSLTFHDVGLDRACRGFAAMNSPLMPIDCHKNLVGASSLAKNLRAPRGARFPALSLTTIASELAPTRVSAELQAQKNRPGTVFCERCGALFQAGHLLDGAFELGVCTIGAGAFWRHRVDAGDRLGEQAVNTTFFLGTLAPSGGITDFRRAQQA